ncbi:MAG: hypothetical protein WCI72_01685 [archaeon]
MELEKYLEKIRTSPDELLNKELGISDNYPIFLNSDFEKVINHFKKSKNYKIFAHYEGQGRQTYRFAYLPGTVILQVFNYLNGGRIALPPGGDKEETAHLVRQRRDYNMTVMLHAYRKKKMQVSNIRARAIVADEICRFAIKENLPICLPESVGTDFLRPFDWSRVVYSS